jgi:uncharacterized protein (DUF433 family)
MSVLDTTVRLSTNDIIWSDPERLSGTPCFRGTRVPVQALFDYLEGGDTLEQFLDDFPGVTREQVLSVVKIASQTFFRDITSAR